MDAPKTTDKEATALDLKLIKQIVALMAENDLSYFHFAQEGSKLELRRGSDLETVQKLLKHLPLSTQAAAPVSVLPAAAASAPSAPAEAARPTAQDSAPAGPTINSPMVGTFYRSAAPGEKAFANIGDSVDENTNVCIIEAMKVMNEIKAEMRGTIARVLVEDGKPVQYGQPLFELKA